MLGAYPVATVAVASLAAGDSVALVGWLETLLTDRYMERVHTIEVAPLDPVTLVPVPLFWADRDYTSEPTDTPANQHFQGSVDQAFTFTQRLPRDVLVGGAAASDAGEITVLIGDGALDAYLDHIWEGQPITIKLGVPGYAYADFVTVATQIIQTKPEATREQMTLRLRSPIELLDQPITTATYAGTGGLEGPELLKGTTKPRAYGHLTGVPPVLLDAANQIYQWSDSAVLAVTAVKDRGVPMDDPIELTLPAITEPYNSADAQWIYNSPGHCRVNLAQGTLQLGGAPSGQITVDGQGKAIGTAVEVLKQMLTDLHPTVPLDPVSWIAESRGAGRGYAYVTSSDTWAALAPKMLAGQGSALIANRLGQIAVTTLRVNQTPTATIPADRIVDDGLSIETSPNPAWRIRFQFAHNWTPIDRNAVAGALDEATKAALARAYLEDGIDGASIRTAYPFAEDPEPITAYLTALDFGEMQRLFALGVTPRRLYRIPLWGRPFTMTLGQPVLLEASRPLAHDKRGVLLSIEEDAQTRMVTVEVLA